MLTPSRISAHAGPASKERVVEYLMYTFLAETLADGADLTGWHFPRQDGRWEAVSPTHRDLGWDTQALEQAIDAVGRVNSTALLILYRGRMVVEQYWRGWNADTAAVVASASKSVTAVLIGLAQERGFLSIDDTVSSHLEPGWSGAEPAHEASVTVRHLLSMTSGLMEDEQPGSPFSRLVAFAPPGSTWRYSSAAYYRLHRVLEAATGRSREAFARETLWDPCGMRRVFYTESRRSLSSTARDLARFAMLIMNHGMWDGHEVIGDKRYLRDMLSAGGPYKLYGYLWWLNGKDGGAEGPRPPSPDRMCSVPQWPPAEQDMAGRDPFCTKIWSAPADMVAARGAGGKCVFLVPSKQLIVIRHGLAPGAEVADRPAALENFIWDRLAPAFRWPE
jgi:CubicO group peptidase (beta-lactamase class C family)